MYISPVVIRERTLNKNSHKSPVPLVYTVLQKEIKSFNLFCYLHILWDGVFSYIHVTDKLVLLLVVIIVKLFPCSSVTTRHDSVRHDANVRSRLQCTILDQAFILIIYITCSFVRNRPRMLM